MFFSAQHILTTILFTPLVGALVLWLIPPGREDLIVSYLSYLIEIFSKNVI